MNDTICAPTNTCRARGDGYSALPGQRGDGYSALPGQRGDGYSALPGQRAAVRGVIHG